MERFYHDIFIEHIGQNFAVSIQRELTLEAMHLFGGYEINSALVYAILGGVLGMVISWAIGRVFASHHHRLGNAKLDLHYARWQPVIARYGVLVLPLCWFPPATLFALFAGMFRVPLWQLLAATFVGAALYASRFM